MEVQVAAVVWEVWYGIACIRKENKLNNCLTGVSTVTETELVLYPHF
jgi:hypothetical protein